MKNSKLPKVGELVGHKIGNSFYVSEVTELVDERVTNIKIKCLFSITNGIRETKSNTGVITMDNIKRKKFKKLLKKFPEYFI